MCRFRPTSNGLNEVERLLSETAVGLDGEGREGVSLALCKVLVLGSLGVLAHDERVTCHSVYLAFDRGGKGVLFFFFGKKINLMHVQLTK